MSEALLDTHIKSFSPYDNAIFDPVLWKRQQVCKHLQLALRHRGGSTVHKALVEMGPNRGSAAFLPL